MSLALTGEPVITVPRREEHAPLNVPEHQEPRNESFNRRDIGSTATRQLVQGRSERGGWVFYHPDTPAEPDEDIFNLGNSELHPHVKLASEIYEQAQLQLAGYTNTHEELKRQMRGGIYDIKLPVVNIDGSAAVQLMVSQTEAGNTQYILEAVNAKGAPERNSGFHLSRNEVGEAYLVPNNRSLEFRVGTKAYEKQLETAQKILPLYFEKLNASKNLGLFSLNVGLQELAGELTPKQGSKKRHSSRKAQAFSDGFIGPPVLHVEDVTGRAGLADSDKPPGTKTTMRDWLVDNLPGRWTGRPKNDYSSPPDDASGGNPPLNGIDVSPDRVRTTLNSGGDPPSGFLRHGVGDLPC